ncbi:hypothetical protein FGKAn22_17050 [Ferrigenium kumadai]|uniref:DUF3619 family protein n=1 Tax=Ferrigenium kumadai TaxID=1682490 RepID=A0AAN1T058_9PROT|nr:DUF3619 family protein [Ferrigenium kumadai]BBJ00013.1 hypothetical protein FGKAn22_17050 [Ferrigenium kumadai]
MSKNTTPREIDPKHIARLLTRAAEQLDDDTVAALRHARNRALERQAATNPAFALSTGHHIHWPLAHAIPQWIGMTVFLVAIVAGGVSYWHHSREEMSHLDVAILTDDLPMEVFVDR